MGAPPTQGYPMGQNQNAGAYAAQGWGAAAYQQWPGQPNDPCISIVSFFSRFLHLVNSKFLKLKRIPMPQTQPHGLPITNSNSSINNPEVELLQPRVAILDSPRAIAVDIFFPSMGYNLDCWLIYLSIIGSVPVNPQTGQPDYTAQWIQYYRSIGAMKDAEALEQQLKASKVRT